MGRDDDKEATVRFHKLADWASRKNDGDVNDDDDDAELHHRSGLAVDTRHGAHQVAGLGLIGREDSPPHKPLRVRHLRLRKVQTKERTNASSSS